MQLLFDHLCAGLRFVSASEYTRFSPFAQFSMPGVFIFFGKGAPLGSFGWLRVSAGRLPLSRMAKNGEIKYCIIELLIRL